MEASILDLRKNMKKVMSALERNERVTLTRRRRKMAVIAGEKQARKIKATDLAAFGMWADREDMQDVSAYVRELRKPRSF